MAPQARGRGLYRAMLQAAIARSWERGAEILVGDSGHLARVIRTIGADDVPPGAFDYPRSRAAPGSRRGS